MEKNRIKRFNENSELNISDVSDSTKILTNEEKQWLRENIWYREHKLRQELKYKDEDVVIKSSIYDKLGL